MDSLFRQEPDGCLPEKTPKCPRCQLVKPMSEFGTRTLASGRITNRAYCKPCDSKRSAEWKSRNYEYAARRDSAINRRLHFGLTEEDYQKMLASQGFSCAICGTKDPRTKLGAFNVDHCHKTDFIRGLLCKLCNTLLGHALDSERILESAIVYLKESKRLAADGKLRKKEGKKIVREKKICIEHECGRVAMAKGLCARHYQKVVKKRYNEKKKRERLAGNNDSRLF